MDKNRPLFRPGEQPSEAPQQQEHKKLDDSQLKQASKDVLSGLNEAIDSSESAEFSDGNVSENTSEDRSQVSQGSIKGGRGDDSTATAQALVKSLPPLELMRKDISQQIKREIKILEKEAYKIMKNPTHVSYFKLNGIVSKIRELKEILSSLAYGTAENIKNLWLKFVKKISI